MIKYLYQKKLMNNMQRGVLHQIQSIAAFHTSKCQ